MKIEITVSDELAAAYKSMSVLKSHTIERVMVSQLERFKDCPLLDRVLVVPAAMRVELEKILSVASLNTPEDLFNAIRRHNEITISGVNLDLTVAEKREIVQYAERNKVAPEAELARRISFVKPLIFNSASIPRQAGLHS